MQVHDYTLLPDWQLRELSRYQIEQNRNATVKTGLHEMKGALKMQEWKKQEWKNREQIAELEYAGVEKSRADRRGGKCRSGKVGSDN